MNKLAATYAVLTTLLLLSVVVGFISLMIFWSVWKTLVLLIAVIFGLLVLYGILGFTVWCYEGYEKAMREAK